MEIITHEFKYGLYFGRFQPPHAGHYSVRNQIEEIGLQPIVIIGSSQEFGTDKNPYHIQDRIKMWKLMEPKLPVYALEDQEDWEKWVQSIKRAIELVVTKNPEEAAICLHNKEEDRMDFTYKGVEYENEFYSKIFEVEGIPTIDLPLSDIPIRATMIREDLEGHKEFLHPEVYKYIKRMEKK